MARERPWVVRGGVSAGSGGLLHRSEVQADWFVDWRFVDEDASLRRFGLVPLDGDLGEIRGILLAQTGLGVEGQDTELMKVSCVQLFNAGHLDDVLVIWQAKESTWDAHCSLDVQLLCGAGLDATKAHLVADGSPVAADALRYLTECEAAGNFAGFSPVEQQRWWAEYYLGGED